MAVSIDWDTGVISVPKSDLTLIQSIPTEILELDINVFRLELKDLEDDAVGIIFPTTHNHNPPVSVGGVTLARVIEILDPYTITFEDGQYAVNLVGANSNIADRVNVNQVSVRSANSAGLVQTSEIEYSSFQNGVTIDTVNGTVGQAYPIGTKEVPVKLTTDAKFIANLRGFDTIFIRGDLDLVSGDSFNDFIFIGQTRAKTTVTIDPAADIQNCTFINCTIQGTLDGGSSIEDCLILDLNYVDGLIEHSSLGGTISLNGAQADFNDCVSSIAGGAFTPIIDLGGGGTNLTIRNYYGGVRLRNHTSGIDDVSVDISSGQVIMDSTITTGEYTIRGVGKLVDNSTGTTVINNELLESADLVLAKELLESDQFFDKSAGLLHYYRRGTTVDLIPPKSVTGEQVTSDVNLEE